MGQFSVNDDMVQSRIAALTRLVDWSESNNEQLGLVMTAGKHRAWSGSRLLSAYRSRRWEVLDQARDVQQRLTAAVTTFRDKLVADTREMSDLDDKTREDLASLANRITAANQQADMYGSGAAPWREPFVGDKPEVCLVPGSPEDLKQKGFTMPDTTSYFDENGNPSFVQGESGPTRKGGAS